MRKVLATLSVCFSLFSFSSWSASFDKPTDLAQQKYSTKDWNLFLEWLRKSHAVYIEGDERPFRYFSQHLIFPEYEKKQRPLTNSYSGIGFSGDIYYGFPKAINSENFGESAIEIFQ